MKEVIIKVKGSTSILNGKIDIGKYRKKIKIDATECSVYNGSIEGRLIIDFDKFNFDDFIEVFNDGFYTILEHIKEGECDYVQE